MIVMDVKGGSWVGDMFQKFEAMCFEVEEVIYEDTFKYVENQVRSVGDSVKKFYSVVMQDLLPPSSLDSVKLQDPLSTVGHDAKVIKSTKTKLDVENGPKQLVTDSLSQVTHMTSLDRAISKAENLDCIKYSQESLSNLPSVADNIANHVEEVSTESCSRSVESSPVHEDACYKEVPEVSHNEDGLGVCTELIKCDGGGAIIHVDGHFPTDSCSTLVKADLNTIITSDVETIIKVVKELSTFDIETSSPILARDFRLCEGNDEGFLVGQPNEVKLEESCVLVGTTNIFPKSGGHVQRSYKKKIQDVFSTRRWTKGKRNQEQLAAWYEEQFGKNSVSTTMMQAKSHSQSKESFETEWELL